MTHTRPAPPSKSWLEARAKAAREFWLDGKLDLGELERVQREANLGFYTGPLRFADGTVSKEDEFLHIPVLKAVKRERDDRDEIASNEEDEP